MGGRLQGLARVDLGVHYLSKTRDLHALGCQEAHVSSCGEVVFVCKPMWTVKLRRKHAKLEGVEIHFL